MRTASLLLLCLPALAAASPAEELELRNIEAQLLHRRVDLGGVRTWQRGSRRWAPLPPSPARLQVVHLWAVDCAPCLQEFPLLRKIEQGWHRQPGVRFVFISETLDEKQMLDYWRGHEAQLPDSDPCQRTDSRIRNVLQTGKQPLTLLLDQRMVIRQAFVGSLLQRRDELVNAMERLLESLPPDKQRPASTPQSASR